ncbi:hypothetical protein TNCV_1246801 [Trichonephila clavipes]|uniref:Uncharacterized protein n=1 Tax=Trichonephila clavipes TaxID=2585209 RepID=A0A8X6RAV9_TRICX|nr:hypothetical protein TNCV_1246801 [Trichonephila clavipes]
MPGRRIPVNIPPIYRSFGGHSLMSNQINSPRSDLILLSACLGVASHMLKEFSKHVEVGLSKPCNGQVHKSQQCGAHRRTSSMQTSTCSPYV